MKYDFNPWQKQLLDDMIEVADDLNNSGFALKNEYAYGKLVRIIQDCQLDIAEHEKNLEKSQAADLVRASNFQAAKSVGKSGMLVLYSVGV